MFLMVLSLKIVFISALTCDAVLEFDSEKKFTLIELQTIEPQYIVQCILHIGKEQLPDKETEFIWKSIIKFYEGIANIPDKMLSQLHWITPAISPQEYSNLTLANIDVVQNFGLNYGLDEARLSAIANRVREDFAGKEPEDYTYYDLTALRQILCAFNRTEIERIRPAAYRETALLIGNLERCSEEVMMGFATLAVQENAFGNPEFWSEKIMKIIGKVGEYVPKEFTRKFNVQTSFT